MKVFLILLIPLLSFCSIFASSISATVAEVNLDSGTFRLVDIWPERVSPGPLEVFVSQGDLQVDYGCHRIRGELIESDGKLRLESIWPDNEQEKSMAAAVNRQLRADTATRQKRQFRSVGDYGINFSMINQMGNYVQFNQYRGKWVILNFIFTRCQVAEMCPAQTLRMGRIQQLAKEQSIENLQLLSVSFDPIYDTPGILNMYGRARGIEPDTFNFLTGDYEVMLDILKQYGVVAMESENIIDHTVVTLLFDPLGKIVMRKSGSMWSAEAFIDRIRKGSNR